MSIGTSKAQLTGVLPRAPGVGPQVRIAPRACGPVFMQSAASRPSDTEPLLPQTGGFEGRVETHANASQPGTLI
jgi:hypothetical protein